MFSRGAQILEEDITEADVTDSACSIVPDRFAHTLFVNGIGALGRNGNLFDRQANGFGLPVEKFATHAMHADAVVGFRDGGH